MPRVKSNPRAFDWEPVTEYEREMYGYLRSNRGWNPNGHATEVNEIENRYWIKWQAELKELRGEDWKPWENTETPSS